MPGDLRPSIKRDFQLNKMVMLETGLLEKQISYACQRSLKKPGPTLKFEKTNSKSPPPPAPRGGGRILPDAEYP
jgi:hypothetical protein